MSNLLPFEGSEEIADIVAYLIDKWEVETFVETGTQRGATALWATQHTPRVITIELEEDRHKEAYSNLKSSGAFVLLGDSATLLLSLEFKRQETVLFFLDAHSMQGTPIVAELGSIRYLMEQFGIVPILCIHDIEVPRHPELGFDHYEDGTMLNLDLIHDALILLGVSDWTIGFNSVPDGAARGFCYITPKI